MIFVVQLSTICIANNSDERVLAQVGAATPSGKDSVDDLIQTKQAEFCLRVICPETVSQRDLAQTSK